MKKSLLIVMTIILSVGLMGINYIGEKQESTTPLSEFAQDSITLNKNIAAQFGIKKKPAFFFEMGPRFRPIKMQELQSAKSAADFLESIEVEQMVEVKSLRIRKFDEYERYSEEVDGDNEILNDEQLDFFRKLTYSSNFVVEVVGDFKVKGSEHPIREMHTPHLTIVPEKQAEYLKGMGVFYQYLRKEAKTELDETDMDLLEAAKLYFTVSAEGEIKEVKLKSSSNYEELDKKIVELIKNLPGEWEPAQNAEGVKVEQELVLSFGRIGC